MDLSSWAEAAVSGAIPLALPVALLAGLVSFFSPCVVPLLPGYLAYATGMNAADIVARNARRSRAVIGTALFVLGLAGVFVAAGIVFGFIGQNLIYQTLITRMVGVVTTVMGLIFAGVIPLGRREVRLQRLPALGLAGAPLLGVRVRARLDPVPGPDPQRRHLPRPHRSQRHPRRYHCLCLRHWPRLPFLIAAVAFARMSRTVAAVRRHQATLLRSGVITMIIVGVLLVTGWWDHLTATLRQWAVQFTTIL